MEVSFINKSDIEEIEKCGKESLPIYYNKSDLLNLIYDKNYIIFKCMDTKNINGFLVANILTNRVHIMSIAVYKEFRRLNCGTNIINFLKNKFKGFYITLNVQQSNENAIKFYKKNGFVIIKKLLNYYSDLECNDAYQMLYFK